jgi:hypothetical protein
VWRESTIAGVEAAVTAAEVQLREARRTAIQAGQAKMALMQQLVTLAKQLSTVQVITPKLYHIIQYIAVIHCCLAVVTDVCACLLLLMMQSITRHVASAVQLALTHKVTYLYVYILIYACLAYVFTCTYMHSTGIDCSSVWQHR